MVLEFCIAHVQLTIIGKPVYHQSMIGHLPTDMPPAWWVHAADIGRTSADVLRLHSSSDQASPSVFGCISDEASDVRESIQ